MKTALFLLVLTVIFGFAATWILEIRLTSSQRGAHRLKQAFPAWRRNFPARHKPKRRATLPAGDHGKSGARRGARSGPAGVLKGRLQVGRSRESRSGAGHSGQNASGAAPSRLRPARTGGLRRTWLQRVEAVIERPVPAGPPKSRAGAASKLVIVIFVYGAGMAILTLVLLRWVGAILRQASA